MATFYLDYENGNDANDGSTWALAWKTLTSGATAARIAPGDVVRIAKSPAPVSVGNGRWTSNTSVPASISNNSSTNTTPIVMTRTGHGYVDGDVVQITGHTINTNANGIWKVANVTANTFELVGSVGNGVGGGTGTSRNLNFKTVTLDTAQNIILDQCETAWTAQNSSTVTLSNSTPREGTNAMSIAKTTPSNNTVYAYKDLGSSMDLSGYQALTFWIRNSVAITAGQWQISFYSDTGAVTENESFSIPAIPSINKWVPLTLSGNTAGPGGNLPSDVESIALKSATTSTTITILLDNICVSKTNGLNLQSLISKNTNEQGGDEPWCPIQSINSDGTVIAIDNGPDTLSTSGWGYYGTSEMATTYIRETIKTAMVSAAGTGVQTILDSGTSGNLISFEGGYNTATSAQDGETFFDGLNGFGYGVFSSSKNFIYLEHICPVRYSIGILMSSFSNSATDIPFSTACTSSGFSATGATNYNNTISIGVFNNHQNNALSLSGLKGCVIPEIKACITGAVTAVNISSNCIDNVFTLIQEISANGGTALSLSNGASTNLFINVANIKYNSTYLQNNVFAFILGGEKNYINAGTLIGGTGCTSAVFNSSGYGNTIAGATATGFATTFINTQSNNSMDTFLRDISSSSSSFVSFTSADYDARIFSYKHGGVAGDNRIYTPNGDSSGAIVSQTTTRHTASGVAWQMRPLIGRTSYLPLRLNIAQVAVEANALVTFKAWVKLDHATNIGAKIIVPGGQLDGVPNDVQTAKAADTNWEELTVTFTPTESGVIQVHMYSWYIAGNSSAYVDDITVTQA